jgi:hypothetical protein
MLERERQPVELDPVAAGDELRRHRGVRLRIRAPGEPPTVFAPFGRTQGRVGKDVLGADLLPSSQRLEDGAAGKLLGPVAEHRPVRDLARRRAAGPDRIEKPAGAPRGERVQVGGRSRLVRRPSPERVVSATAEPVDEGEDDR